ncbi:MAG TPA: acetyl-CoA carboxylase biotin carboxyl carrier protein subunit [Solibacterales bacterium]|jgi:biotin carboxyl carrier protein|nr:acetyl-CoA carboxylase biotin carboxyl carrier protein subunit [Bryobacterales bacterium]
MKRTVRVNGEPVEPAHGDVVQVGPGVFSVLVDGRVYEARMEGESIVIGGARLSVEVEDPRRLGGARRQTSASGRAVLRSTIPGKVVRVMVQVGQAVVAGQGVLVIEAMKMQNEVKSPREGVVTAVNVVEHETVASGSELVVIEG